MKWIILIISVQWHLAWLWCTFSSIWTVQSWCCVGNRKNGKALGSQSFWRGQIVMTRRLGQIISKMAILVRCSWYAVDSIYQKWPTEEHLVTRWWALHSRQLSIRTMDQGKMVAWSDNSFFISIIWVSWYICVTYMG